MDTQKILLCNNSIVDALKDYNLDELKLFYNLLYLYMEESIFKNDSIIDEIRMGEYQIKDIFKKHKIKYDGMINFIENLPTQIKFINKDGLKAKYISVFEYIEYNYEEEELIILFTESIKPYLDNIIGNFSKIDLYELQLLRKRYSQRVYELYCRYKNQKKYMMKIEVFKKYFNIPESYSMSEIERTILKSSKEEINKKLNKNINYSKIKKGRNITHIMFSFN